MKIPFKRIALGIVGMLFLTSIPGYSATIITFVGASGTYTGTGNTVASTGFTGNQIQEKDTLTNVTTDFSVSYTVAFNNATPTLSISVTSGQLGDLGSLYSAVTSLSLSNSDTPGSGNLSDNAGSGVNGVSIQSSAAAFLTDLDLAAGTTFTLGGGFTGNSPGNMVSDSLTLSTANNELTPEPGSIFLLGGGLLAIAAIARKRRFGTA